MIKTFSALWKWFIYAMFPLRCLVCKREGALLCPIHKKFKVAPPSRAIFDHVDEIFAATAYNDMVCKKIITSFKFRGISDVAEIMSDEIVYKNKKFLENSILVPIPLHWTRKLWRGFNQAGILAEKIAEKVPSATVINILKRVEKTAQQATLSKQERINNTQNAFIFDGSDLTSFYRKQRLNSIKNKHIILVDDVVASGATLDAAAKTLKIAGFQNVKAVVFARGGSI